MRRRDRRPTGTGSTARASRRTTDPRTSMTAANVRAALPRKTKWRSASPTTARDPRPDGQRNRRLRGLDRAGRVRADQGRDEDPPDQERRVHFEQVQGVRGQELDGAVVECADRQQHDQCDAIRSPIARGTASRSRRVARNDESAISTRQSPPLCTYGFGPLAEIGRRRRSRQLRRPQQTHSYTAGARRTARRRARRPRRSRRRCLRCRRRGWMRSPTSSITSASKPRVVTPAVPTRIPEGLNGERVSPGTVFPLRTMFAAASASAASPPPGRSGCESRRSTNTRWLSVPPETRENPWSCSVSASTSALSTTFCAYSSNEGSSALNPPPCRRCCA